MIQLSDYRCGGYFLSRPGKKFPENSPFLPEKIISLSKDICNFFPDSWAIEWVNQTPEERLGNAKRFELSPKQLEEIKEWATKGFDVDILSWNVIPRLEIAQYLRNRFLAHLPDVVLLGVGLHSSLCSNFLDKTKPPPTQPGFAPNGETGVHAVIKKNEQLAPGGLTLGFEPMSYFVAGFECSWLCTYLEVTAREKWNILTNENGLIDSYTDALKTTNLIEKEKAKEDPLIWFPWLIVDYSKV